MVNLDIRYSDVAEITSRLHSNGITPIELKRVLIDIVPGIGSRFEGLISFLARINFLTIKERKIIRTFPVTTSDVANEVGDLVLSCVELANAFSEHCNGVELYDVNSRRVFIDSSRTSSTFLWFILFLTEFGILIRNHKNLYSVTKEWEGKFFEFLSLCSNVKTSPNKLSPNSLKKLIDHNLEVGYQAELFALEFERSRLKAHPFVDLIAHVALSDAAAGYDILSYEFNTELLRKRYIEVKSWSIKEEFYFSKNEFNTALEKGSDYCIYLRQ